MRIRFKIVISVVFWIPLLGFSQVDIFEKYNNNSDVTFVSISPKMFQMIAEMGIDVEDVEAKAYMEMVKSITSFKTIKTDKPDVVIDIKNWVKYQSTVLKELTTVKENGDLVMFYVKPGSDSLHVNELLIFINASDDIENNIDSKKKKETTVVLLTGNINLNELTKLTAKMNIPGGQHLNKN